MKTILALALAASTAALPQVKSSLRGTNEELEAHRVGGRAQDQECVDGEGGPECVSPAPETCTPVEPCDHGACDGECVYSLTNDMMVCVTDSTLTECEGWACDAQPGGDPECVWTCPGYDDPHGDLVEEPALCLSGQVCMDGAFCA